MKRCTKCEELKALSEFYTRRASPDGLEYRCKTCAKSQSAEHGRTQEALTRNRVRNQRNRTENPEPSRASGRKWVKANRGAHNAATAVYRARLKSATPPDANKAAIKAIYNDVPIIELLLGEKCHVDHVIPLARGGLHHEKNLQILPARLNLKKGARLECRDRPRDSRSRACSGSSDERAGQG